MQAADSTAGGAEPLQVVTPVLQIQIPHGQQASLQADDSEIPTESDEEVGGGPHKRARLDSSYPACQPSSGQAAGEGADMQVGFGLGWSQNFLSLVVPPPCLYLTIPNDWCFSILSDRLRKAEASNGADSCQLGLWWLAAAVPLEKGMH